MNWSTIFDSTFVSNFWTEFNGTINSWIGFTGTGLYAVSGVLVAFFAFMIALAILARILLMIRKITANPGMDGDSVESDSSAVVYRDA